MNPASILDQRTHARPPRRGTTAPARARPRHVGRCRDGLGGPRGLRRRPRAPGVTERLLEVADIRPGERVLELACGPGGAGLAAAEHVGRTARWSSPTSSPR